MKRYLEHALGLPLKNGFDVYPYQKQAVIEVGKYRKLIVGYDMGLGKTLIGCLVSRGFAGAYSPENGGGCGTLIICPKTLKKGWEICLKDQIGGDFANDTRITNYEQLQEGENPLARFSVGDSSSENSENLKKKSRKLNPGSSSSSSSAPPLSSSDKLDRKQYDDEEWSEILKREERLLKDHESKEEKKKTKSTSTSTSTSTSKRKKAEGAQSETSSRPLVKNFLLICDEAHHIQSMTTIKTKSVLALAKHKSCVAVLLLTGTPMKNGKNSQLFPLLRAIDHPLGKNQREYEAKYCGGSMNSFGGRNVWTANGATNGAELNAQIGYALLRKTKDEVLKLPEQKRKIRQVTMAKVDQSKYAFFLKELKTVHEQKKKDLAAGNNKEDHLILGQLTNLRQASAYAKVDYCTKLCIEILEHPDDDCVLVFTTFVNVGQQLKERLEERGVVVSFMHGQVKASDREAMVKHFQAGLISVLICTYGVGGVGITLTKARSVILIDRAWSPGDVFQAEDRVRRIGQTKEVHSYWLQSSHMCKEVDALIESKSKNSDAAVLGKGNGGDKMSISVKELLAAAQTDLINFLPKNQLNFGPQPPKPKPKPKQKEDQKVDEIEDCAGGFLPT